MSFGSYLVGCLGLTLGLLSLVTSGILLQRRLVAGWTGPVAWVTIAILAVAAALVPAVLLGTFGLLEGWAWLLLAVLSTAGLWLWQRHSPTSTEGPSLVGISSSPALNSVGIAIAAAVVGVFTAEVALKLGTGMTAFDSNWYHGPLAADMVQSGNTFSLHQLAPAFLSWFYPHNSELIHGLGILAFGNDFLSPLINLLWLGGCLVAAWSIGRPYGAAPLSLAAVALVLGSMAMADQAGEARNDIVGMFFVLAGLAVLINSAAGGRRISTGPAIVVALAAGLALGTKINFIPAAVVLVGGVIWLTEPERRVRIAAWGTAIALVGGGYWYLRNLIQSGNPLPWVDHLGPLSLPGPQQDIGGREAGSVLGYLGNLDVIRDWFIPGLHEGFGPGWVIVLALALAGMVVCLVRGSGPARRVGAIVGFALLLAWLAAPTSASGYPGEPSGFLTGLRYLGPALVVGMALLGSGFGPRGPGARWSIMVVLLLLLPFTIAAGPWTFRYWLVAVTVGVALWVVAMVFLFFRRSARVRTRIPGPRSVWVAFLILAGLVTVSVGQPVQRYYFEHRYATADYTTPGLAATFAWARDIEGERIGTTTSRQYPLFGLQLTNRVQFIGIKGDRGGFVRADDCRTFREAVNRGGYRYLVTALDRIGSTRKYPREAGWVATAGSAREVLRVEGAVVFKLTGPLDPDGCR